MSGPVTGGSGLYQIDGLTDAEWRRVKSPFGGTLNELYPGLCPASRDGLLNLFPERRTRAAA